MTEDTFDAELHRYTQNGVEVPSVTKIVAVISPLPYIPPDDLEWLRTRGQHVHTATELYEDGVLDFETLDERIRPHVDAWQMFLETTGFRTLHKEMRVDHYKLGYAGRLDRVGYFPKRPKRLALVDIKSGDVTIGAGPQTAGYTAAWNSEHPAHMFIRDRYAVRLTEEGTAKVVHLGDPFDFRAFQAGLVIYRWRKQQ